MRICFVVHGYPPDERTGVENYTEGLARELARRGHEVHVFTRRTTDTLGHLMRRAERRDGTTVHWLTTNRTPGNEREALDPPGVADEFVAFLDEVRPDVVHFQHVIKLGIGLLVAARERGIPVVYTVHDFYPICHRFTLLRPDLRNCGARQDPSACARCDRAVALLGSFDLGDFQLGVFEHELDAERYARLREALDPATELPEDALALRRDLDAARLQAFLGVDLFVAPSQHVADVLVEGGFERERFLVQANGLDLDELTALEAPRRVPGRKLRLGFFGGLSKHKGVQDLLEAFDGLQDAFELTIHGYTTDAAHLARLEAAAERVGARMAGPYDRADVATLYESVDVVVVPSIWSENQPLVIREAFAARRPVVTVDYGALPENVADGVDGLLYEPWEPASLREVLRRLATEDGLFERLVAGAPEPKLVATQADELERRYVDLVAARDERRREDRAALPRSLQEPAALHRALEDLSRDQLVERAVVGLASLRAAFGLPDDARALADGLAMRLAGHDELTELRRKAGWLEADHDALVAENAWRRETMAAQEEELDWLRGNHARAIAAQAELVDGFERLERTLADLGADTSKMREALGWARGDLGAMGKLALSAIDVQYHLLESELRPLLAAVGEEPEHEEGPIQALRRTLASTHDLLAELEASRRELEWRRDEMADVRAKLEAGALGMVLKRSKLAERVRGWDGEEGR